MYASQFCDDLNSNGDSFYSGYLFLLQKKTSMQPSRRCKELASRSFEHGYILTSSSQLE